MVRLGGSEPRPRMSGRLIGFGLIVVLAFSVLGLQIAYMDLHQVGYYRAQASNNRVRIIQLPAARGIFHDRNGLQLVQNLPSFSAEVVPFDLASSTSQRLHELRQLAWAVGVPVNTEERLIRADSQPLDPVLIKANLSYKQAETLNEALPTMPGVKLALEPLRHYLYPQTYSQILGYVGPITAQEWPKYRQQGYLLTSQVGQAGLEAGLQPILSGQTGKEEVEINASGQVIKVLSVQPAQPGPDVYLTIDNQLQQYVTQALTQGLQAVRQQYGASYAPAGAVVVTNPNNGQILAMVSWPTYSSNSFEQGITQAQYSQLLNASGDPLFNWAIDGAFAPGSTFKMVTTAAALQTGVMAPGALLDCPAAITYDNWVYHNWATWNMGYMNFQQALAASCDTFFYQVGLKTGDVAMARYARYFGMGSSPQIALPGAAPGVIADSYWKQAYWKQMGWPQQPWYPGDTITTAIGQGYNLVTPLQAAMYTSTLANWGTLYQPQLISKIVYPNGRVQLMPAKVVRHVPVSRANLAVIRQGMHWEVNKPFGTGYLLRGQPYDAAGKTGSAQYGVAGPSGQSPQISWYDGFAPYNNPQIAVTVMIENAGPGNELSAEPVAANIFAYWWAHRKQIP